MVVLHRLALFALDFDQKVYMQYMPKILSSMNDCRLLLAFWSLLDLLYIGSCQKYCYGLCYALGDSIIYSFIMQSE